MKEALGAPSTKEAVLWAFTVWRDMMANKLSPEETAENFDLPLDAVTEIVQYCERHQDLLNMEADEERLRLEERGVSFEPNASAQWRFTG